MHKRWSEIGFALLMGLVVPAILFSFDIGDKQHRFWGTQETQSASTASQNARREISVLMGDTIQKMDLETYLVSVVLREMPSSFEPEALKAQAVVARTYTLRRSESGGKHDEASVCTSPACCQGYCSPDEFLSTGGTQELIDKVTDAVNATQNEVLLYNGELIEATYFSCSGGRTEDAVAVWGSDIPYLQATDSPGEESAKYFVDAVTMSADAFADKMQLDKSIPSWKWIGDIVYTDGGGVDTIQLAGKTYRGTTVRQKLGLRSTVFLISIVGDSVTITTKGFGHRVGMSQYGAEAMAIEGKTYRQILEHYYKDTQLAVLSSD